MASLSKFIATNLILPDSVKKGLVGGTILIVLDIDSSGQIQKIQKVSNIEGCSQCGKEALRIVSLLPKPAFRPAIENNVRIPSKYNLSIRFKIHKSVPLIYTAENLIGGWSFMDNDFKTCTYCPTISFKANQQAELISDKLSWKIENNKLFISNLAKPTRADYFLKDSVYEMTFENYFRQLTLVGKSTTYKLIKK
jgi:hypothetical protein